MAAEAAFLRELASELCCCWEEETPLGRDLGWTLGEGVEAALLFLGGLPLLAGALAAAAGGVAGGGGAGEAGDRRTGEFMGEDDEEDSEGEEGILTFG